MVAKGIVVSWNNGIIKKTVRIISLINEYDDMNTCKPIKEDPRCSVLGLVTTFRETELNDSTSLT
jgi:hypothetical protein